MADLLKLEGDLAAAGSRIPLYWKMTIWQRASTR